MECTNCQNRIAPGTEIVVDKLLRERAHCPYCLHVIAPEPVSTKRNNNDGSARRDEMRAKVRNQFVDRLLSASTDGHLHCPVCEHTLNKTDEQFLRDSENFRCHLCGHDLATVAYRQEVYHEQRWLPVLYALQDQLTDKNCADCCYLGAIAKACQKAYSWMPHAKMRHREQLARLVRGQRRTVPDCNLESCVAIAQYRKLAGEGLLLL